MSDYEAFSYSQHGEGSWRVNGHRRGGGTDTVATVDGTREDAVILTHVVIDEYVRTKR